MTEQEKKNQLDTKEFATAGDVKLQTVKTANYKEILREELDPVVFIERHFQIKLTDEQKKELRKQAKTTIDYLNFLLKPIK